MSEASRQGDIGKSLQYQRSITGHRTTRSMKPMQVQPRHLARVRLLFIGRSVDLEQRRGARGRGKSFDHRERSRQTRLVPDEQMPVSVFAQRDFAAWADCLDLITDSGSAYPIRPRSRAMERHVDEHRCSRCIERADRIATIDHSVAALWDSQHQVLTWHVVKAVEARSSQDDAVQRGGECSGLDHLEVPKGGVGQWPTGAAHEVKHSIRGHVEEVYQFMVRFVCNVPAPCWPWKPGCRATVQSRHHGMIHSPVENRPKGGADVEENPIL